MTTTRAVVLTAPPRPLLSRIGPATESSSATAAAQATGRAPLRGAPRSRGRADWGARIPRTSSTRVVAEASTSRVRGRSTPSSGSTVLAPSATRMSRSTARPAASRREPLRVETTLSVKPRSSRTGAAKSSHRPTGASRRAGTPGSVSTAQAGPRLSRTPSRPRSQVGGFISLPSGTRAPPAG